MTRPDGGYYLYIHPSLLNDERFAAMTPTQHGAWTILFLALEYEPRWGWFRDRTRAIFWLTRFGWRNKDAADAIDALQALGWFDSLTADSPTFTIHGWHEWAAKGRKQELNAQRGDRSEENAKRSTTRVGRRRSVEERGGDVEVRGGTRDERKKKNVPPQTPPSRGGRRNTTIERHDRSLPTPAVDSVPGSLKAKLAEYGYAPADVHANGSNGHGEAPVEEPSTEGLTADA